MKNNFKNPVPQIHDAVESCLNSEDATVVISTKANPVSSIMEESTLGEFMVESEIGRGAMGRVYKAWQPSNERYVALKTIDPFFSNSDLHLNRFMREGFAQDKLKHPNVVEVYAFGKIEDTPYIAFDLIREGETLRHRLLNLKEKLPKQEVISIVLSVARALEYSHRKMVVHRDVKPSNILMDGNVPKLTDFGLAFLKTQDVSRITHSGDIVGTIGYMPPEQVKGSRSANENMPTPQWDIYSLGATFYELLTGSLPFRAETNVRLIANIVEKDPPSFNSYGLEIDKDLEAICFKCLEKSPKNRYQTASEFIDDLERYLSNQQVRASHFLWQIRRKGRYICRHRVPLLALSIVVIACGISGRTILRSAYSKQLYTLISATGKLPEGGIVYKQGFLKKAYLEGNLEARIAAITALCRKNTEQTKKLLLLAAQDDAPEVRAHLLNQLVNSPVANPEAIYRFLLNDPLDEIVAAAFKFSDELDTPEINRVIKLLSFSKRETVRTYAILSQLRRLGLDNQDFVDLYFKEGPVEGRLELMDLFLKGYSPTPIPTLIKILSSKISANEKEVVSQCLDTVTGEAFGTNSERWDKWWEIHEGNWETRQYVIIIDATNNWKLKMQDMIWEVGGQKIKTDFDLPISEDLELIVLRDKKFVTINGPISAVTHQKMYVGTLYGIPVGNNGLARKLRMALN